MLSRSLRTKTGGVRSVSFGSLFGSSNMPRVPLTQPLPYKASEQKINTTQEAAVTTLQNGLRVVSLDQPSGSSVGVFIDSGSRNDQVAGTTQIVEGMLLKSSSNRSAFRLRRDLEKLGVTIATRADREHLQLTADTLRENVPFIVNTFADILRNPKLDEAEIETTISHVAEQAAERGRNCETLVMDGLHRAAFGGKTVGKPLYPAEWEAAEVSPEDVAEYVEHQFTPDRIVLAGVGVDHAELVKYAQTAFPHDARTAAPSATPAASEAAAYVGGDVRVTSHDHEDGQAHLGLAFSAPSWLSPDLVPMCVLQVLMGGGGSFSAGGPGKGMCSRVYETVLNQYHFVQHASCFNSIFSDAALFGIYGVSAPEHLDELAQVLVATLKSMAGPLRPGELDRARNALKSNLAMQLEQRPFLLEDIGRQLLTYKKVQTVAEVSALIDKVTEGDIQRVARQMMSNPLTLSAYGDVARLPTQQQFAAQFRF